MFDKKKKKADPEPEAREPYVPEEQELHAAVAGMTPEMARRRRNEAFARSCGIRMR